MDRYNVYPNPSGSGFETRGALDVAGFKAAVYQPFVPDTACSNLSRYLKWNTDLDKNIIENQ